MSPDPRFRYLTADEVRAVVFNRSQLGWRGYSEDEVEAFVAAVADSMAVVDDERAALRAEIARLRNYYRSRGDDVDGSHKHRRTTDDLVSAVEAYSEAQV